MLKAHSLLLAFALPLLTGSAQAQQEKAEPKKASREECRFLAFLIRQAKIGLRKLPTRDDLQGEERKKWESYYEAYIAKDEALYEKVCR